MRHLKQKFNSAIHRHPWALQATMAILIAVCAVGFTNLKSYALFPPDNKIYDLTVGSPIAGNPESKIALANKLIPITWKLNQTDDNVVWAVDIYLLKAEDPTNQVNKELYPIAKNVPASRLNYLWMPMLSQSSLDDMPNPFDRHIYAVLHDTNGGFVDYSTSSAFTIMPWHITQPSGGTLVAGEIVQVKWKTKLIGPARLFLQTTLPDGSFSHIPVIDRIPRLEDLSVNWTVGCVQKIPGGACNRLPIEKFGVDAYLYPLPLGDLYEIPAKFYRGYDNIPDTEQLQYPFVMRNDNATRIVSGTYYSKPFDIVTVSNIGTLNVKSLDTLKADFFNPQPEDIARGTDVDFAIGFFDVNNNRVYTSADNSSIDNLGYYQIPEEQENSLRINGFGFPINTLQEKMARIKFIRFRITMARDFYYWESSPWVQSVTLEYTSDTSVGIGTIEFLNPPVGGKDIPKGTSDNTFRIKVTPPIPTYSGSIVVEAKIVNKLTREETAGITSQIPNPVVFSSTGAREIPITINNINVDATTPVTVYEIVLSGGGYAIGGDKAYINVTTPPIDPSVTLNLTIPVEEISPTTFIDSSVHPLFTLRLYNSTTDTKVYESLNFAGTISADKTKYTKTVTATRATLPNSTYSVLPNGTYSVFIRSNRHLWSKLENNLIINTDNIYGITFPALKVGNVDENNKINMVDFNIISPYYGQTMANLLGDLNNDGKVNMGDLDWIIKNFALWGSQLPGEIR